MNAAAGEEGAAEIALSGASNTSAYILETTAPSAQLERITQLSFRSCPHLLSHIRVGCDLGSYGLPAQYQRYVLVEAPPSRECNTEVRATHARFPLPNQFSQLHSTDHLITHAPS